MICEEDAAVAVSPAGVEGAVVSGAGGVAAMADDDGAEIFPAASKARTV